MSWTQSTLETKDGARLCLYSAAPKTAPKAVIQINHGMAEHAERYERFANALTAAGYAACAHDHRGHGHTHSVGSSQGIFARKRGWDLVLEDVAAVNTHIREAHPDTPIVCFGHSMGSIIAFNHILRAPSTVDAAALWNAGVETGALAAIYGAILKTQRMFKGSDVPSGIAKILTFDAWNKQFAPNRTEFDWLSRDEEEVDAYVADPLCGFDISIGLWLDVLRGIYFAASNKNLLVLPDDLPIHLQAGTDDPCSENGKVVAHIEQRMTARGMTDVTFNLLEDTRHESLNEINREETTARFVAWLDERFG